MRAGRAEFFVTYIRAAPPAPYQRNKNNDGRSIEFIAPVPKEEFDWRPVAVDVRPESITVRFDGKPLTYPRAGLRGLDMFARQLQVPGDESGRLDPRGGLGFYVSNSSASFRHVRVGPLPTE